MAGKRTKRVSNKNSGQFKLGDRRTIEAAKRGAAAQPIEAKRLGGTNSQED